MKKTKTAILIFDIALGLLFFILIGNRLWGSLRETLGDSVAGGGYQENSDGEQEGKKIALTFDDGPHPTYTEELLDGLKERGIHATFFVTGEHAQLHPDVIRRMQEDA